MGQIATGANSVFRDFTADGVASSGPHEPLKSEIRALFGQVDGALGSLGAAVSIGAVAYATRAELYADLAHAAGALGIVYGDTAPAQNGVYAKSGASGSGAWAITPLCLPVDWAAIAHALSTVQDSGITPVTGYYHRTFGTLVSDAGFHSIKTTPGQIRPGSRVRVTSRVSGGSLAMAVWYDADNNVLSYTNGGTNGVNDDYDEEEVVAPAGAAYVAVSGTSSHPLELGFDQYLQLDAVLDLLDAAPAEFAKIETIVTSLQGYVVPGDFALSTGYLNWGGDGSPVANSGFRYSLIDVEPGELLRYTGRVAGAATCMALFYDSTDTKISGSQVQVGVNGENHDFYDYDITVPAGAAKAGLTWEAGFDPKLITVRRLMPDVGEQISEALRGSQNYWEGKSWVWVGTSIPTSGYPEMAAAARGATVNNVAVGSSAARFGVAPKRSATDPYGITGCFYANIAYSLAMTVAEKQDFIDNYEADWKPLLAGSGRPDTLSPAEQAKILSCSWENKFAAGLGATDLVCWDHGYNDWGMNKYGTDAGALTGGSGDMLFLPSTLGSYPDPLTGVGAHADPSRDRGTFLGAMNYLIDQWNRENNFQRHLIVGHYERDRSRNVSDGQMALQQAWGMPIIKTWEYSGASQQTIRAEDGAVVLDGGSPLTITRVLMDDDIHPFQAEFKATLAAIYTSLIASIR